MTILVGIWRDHIAQDGSLSAQVASENPAFALVVFGRGNTRQVLNLSTSRGEIIPHFPNPDSYVSNYTTICNVNRISPVS